MPDSVSESLRILSKCLYVVSDLTVKFIIIYTWLFLLNNQYIGGPATLLVSFFEDLLYLPYYIELIFTNETSMTTGLLLLGAFLLPWPFLLCFFLIEYTLRLFCMAIDFGIKKLLGFKFGHIGTNDIDEPIKEAVALICQFVYLLLDTFFFFPARVFTGWMISLSNIACGITSSVWLTTILITCIVVAINAVLVTILRRTMNVPVKYSVPTVLMVSAIALRNDGLKV